jgi:hypothetical protein
MTEAEWLTCADPETMLPFLRGKVSNRKLRLFACACYRRNWPSLKEPWHRRAVEMAEAYADGLVSRKELEAARRDASGAPIRAASTSRFFQEVELAAVESAALGASGTNVGVGQIAQWRARVAAECEAQAGLLRDIAGNPFRPVAVEEAWQTSAVVGIAQRSYDARDFAVLPILADALEDAGCGNADILAHCRGSGPHVRGCWVVDLLLGKS